MRPDGTRRSRSCAAVASSPCRPTRSTASRSRSRRPAASSGCSRSRVDRPTRRSCCSSTMRPRRRRAGVMTPAAAALAAACWPGGLTIIVPQRPDVPWPSVLTGGGRHDRSAGARPRCPASPRARRGTAADDVGERVRPAGSQAMPPGSSSSSGTPSTSCSTAGSAHGGPASTVVDCTGAVPVVVRVGAVPVIDVAAILDRAGVEHHLTWAR